MNREDLRRRFLPDKLLLLFIGESPPASGRFFYQADSGLYRAMRDAFQIAAPGITDEGFLAAFQASGCYLIDLCGEPVDKLSAGLRRALCVAGEAGLTRTIRRMQPRTIATVVRSIEPNVERAIQRAQWRGEVLDLPYPGRWARHRSLFIEKVVAEVEGLLG